MKTQILKSITFSILFSVFYLLTANAQPCNGNKVLCCCGTKNPLVTNCKCVSVNQLPCCSNRMADDQPNAEVSLSILPNPVSNSTTISFSLVKAEKTSLKIFDVNGRLVSTLADETFEAGQNEIVWDAENINAGVYFLQFQSAEILQTEKLIVTK